MLVVSANICGATLRFNRDNASESRERGASSVWHAPCNTLGMPQDQPAATSGRPSMTFNFASTQQLIASVIAAVAVSTLFISAAVGPAAQFI
jgi:hypothetical protein